MNGVTQNGQKVKFSIKFLWTQYQSLYFSGQVPDPKQACCPPSQCAPAPLRPLLS